MTKQDKIEAGTLSSAMALAFAEIEKVAKNSENPAFKQGGKAIKYADLGAVIDTIKPVLVAHSLFFTQRCQPAEDGVSVETVVHHASGETMCLGTLYLPANKRDAQGFGSALSYARRYSLMTAFGLSAEDDDGNAAAQSVPARIERSEPISDSQRDLIQALAPSAGKSLQAICEAYKVKSLKELTAKQGEATIAKLQSLSKEPVNA